jgi:hypothetical protein
VSQRLWGDQVALNPQLVEGMERVKARGRPAALSTLENDVETMKTTVTHGTAVEVQSVTGTGAPRHVEAGHSLALLVGKYEVPV